MALTPSAGARERKLHRRHMRKKRGKRRPRRVVGSRGKFEFYRAETGMLLQGEMRFPSVNPGDSQAKGPCPAGVDESVYRRRDCFEHDPDCGCHGPIMQRGMVGWAGGAGGGPHFFIYTGNEPANHWSHDHTVWGVIDDPKSMALVDRILTFPTKSEGGMTMLIPRVSFGLFTATSD